MIRDFFFKKVIKGQKTNSTSESLIWVNEVGTFYYQPEADKTAAGNLKSYLNIWGLHTLLSC